MTIIEEMFEELNQAPQEVLPSKYWQELNKKNLGQLKESGMENFKRTLALNYFTFIVGHKNAQYMNLKKNLSPLCFAKAAWRSFLPKHEFFNKEQSIKYNMITNMLWEFALKNDPEGYLSLLDEPLAGNPPKVYAKNRLISQDLANSVLEYYSIMDSAVDCTKVHTIMELGAGYGRSAYVFLKLLPKCKVFVVDIPPALYVSQSYLTGQFPEKKAFTFRPFTSYPEVEGEMKQADIVFLLPHQMELLKEQSIDLFYNISSLHEMRLSQIGYYFKQIERLTSRYFYFKQWKISRIPFDEITIKEDEYPIPASWKKIYHRDCSVQSDFFEALYNVDILSHKSSVGIK